LYEGPKEEYLPYKNDVDGIPFMVNVGDGYRFHTTGLTHDERVYPIINAECQKVCVSHLLEKIDNNTDKITKIEEKETDDAEVVVLSYGITSRVAVKAVQDAKKQGIKVGTLRLITAWPFPEKRVKELATQAKAIVVPEINAGQVVTEVERVVAENCKVISVPHYGGWVHNPDDILKAIKEAVK
jgi:2-oxoglutarate ferredoxin oxidoreductase subunit alpha